MNLCQNFRLKLLKSGPERFEEDGLRSLQYNCRLMEERKLYTWIYVNLDEKRVLAVRIIAIRIVMIMQIDCHIAFPRWQVVFQITFPSWQVVFQISSLSLDGRWFFKFLSLDGRWVFKFLSLDGRWFFKYLSQTA